MHLEIFPLLFAAAITGVVGLPQASLSSCVQTTLEALAQEIKCGLADIGCLCQQPTILSTIKNSVTPQCGASDAQAAVGFAQTQCATAGYNVAAVAASSSAAPESTSTTVISSMTVTSTLVPATSTTSMPASIAATMPTMAPASNSTWNGTMISPSPFHGAADGVKMGGIAAGLVGVAVAFAMM